MSQELWQREVDGKIERKRRNAIRVIWTDENGKEWQTFNPKDELLISAGWTKYVVPEVTEEQKLAIAKSKKKLEIQRYDKSSEVNEFFVNGISLWLSKEDRTGLKLRFESELAAGKTTTTLWGNGVQFPLSLVNEDGSTGLAFQMLYALELYASACYDNTQSHLSVVDKLETTEEVEFYDFKVGYPDKLNF